MPYSWHQDTGHLIYPAPSVMAWRAGQMPLAGRVVDLNTHVAIPADLDNLQTLAARGIVTPEPLSLWNYAWPRSPAIKAPYKAQIVTANLLTLHPQMYVLSEMRTGKTLSSLWAADFIMRLNPGMRAMVWASLSTLKDVWEREIFANFLGARRCALLTAGKRWDRLDSDVDFYILNHDAVRDGVEFDEIGRMKIEGFARELMARRDIQICICDEASVFKDASSHRSRVARKIMLTKKYRWAMTGSPTPQSPTDIHGLRKLIEPLYGESMRVLRTRFLIPTHSGKMEPKPGAYEEAAEMLRPAVRFKAAECFDIPPQSITYRYAERTDAQNKVLRDLRQQAMALIQVDPTLAKPASVANAAALRIKTLQVLSGVIYDDDHTGHAIPAKPRYAVLNEIAAETSDKVIILSPFTSVLNAVKRYIGSDVCEYVDGTITAGRRSEAIANFKTNDKKRFLVAHPEVLKFGLDLAEASVIVWFGPTDKTEAWIQANKRICGPRQKKPTLVVCVESHSLEREVYERLQNRADMQDVLLKLIEEGGKK